MANKRSTLQPIPVIPVYTVQYRDIVRTEVGLTLAAALALGLASGDAFDVSNNAGAIVWAWEMRT